MSPNPVKQYTPPHVPLNDNELAAFAKGVEGARAFLQKLVDSLTPTGDFKLGPNDRSALVLALGTWGGKDPLLAKVLGDITQSGGPTDGPTLHHP